LKNSESVFFSNQRFPSGFLSLLNNPTNAFSDLLDPNKTAFEFLISAIEKINTIHPDLIEHISSKLVPKFELVMISSRIEQNDPGTGRRSRQQLIEICLLSLVRKKQT